MSHDEVCHAVEIVNQSTLHILQADINFNFEVTDLDINIIFLLQGNI
jgi:hypothetical protein